MTEEQASDGAKDTGADAPTQGQDGSKDDAPRPEVIARLNAEAKDWRQKYEAAQADLKKREDAEKTELQRLADSTAEHERERLRAEQSLQEERVGRAIEKAAVRLGFIDPDVAEAMVDRTLIKIEDARPDPKSVEAALQSLAKAKPVLVGDKGSGAGDGGARSTITTTDPDKAFGEAVMAKVNR